jgi:hypothetical protein
MFKGVTPNITPAQVTAFVAWDVAQAVSFGWVSGTQSQLLISIGSTVVSAIIVVADAIIRHGRATGGVTSSAFTHAPSSTRSSK